MKQFPFSLRMLLIILALVVMYFVGRRTGYQCGYVAAEADHGVGPTVITTPLYDVSDLVIPQPEKK